MPDFRRWELNAARPDQPAVPEEFSWSPAKHFLFRKCRRAWYFRHYLAQGGWDVLSGDAALHAYLLKYLSTLDGWLGEVLEESAVRALLAIAAVPPDARAEALTEELQTEVSARLLRASDELASEAYLDDPKLTSFAELHYQTGEFVSGAALMNAAKERFTLFFRLWEDSELPDELASVDPLCWRLPPEHRSFRMRGINISLRPWLYAVQHHGVQAWTFHFFSASSGEMDLRTDEEEYGLTERVFAAWCAEKYPGFSVRVKNISCTEEGLIRHCIIPVPVSSGFVCESADAMHRLLRLPGGVTPEHFERTEYPENCQHCSFRGLCENYPPRNESR